MLNMTNQETFDKVATHLFEQGHPAKNIGSSTCQYRARNGDTCAVGCLIPEELYNPIIEGGSYSSFGSSILPERRAIFELLGGNDTESLLCSLQSVHDINENWDTDGIMKAYLKDIADRFELSADVLEDLTFKKKKD